MSELQSSLELFFRKFAADPIDLFARVEVKMDLSEIHVDTLSVAIEDVDTACRETYRKVRYIVSRFSKKCNKNYVDSVGIFDFSRWRMEISAGPSIVPSIAMRGMANKDSFFPSVRTATRYTPEHMASDA